MNKCGVIALRNILLIILCVASISFLRNYQIVKTTVYIASENVVKENLSSGYNVGAVWPPALGIWNLSSGSSHGLSSVHGSLKSLHDGQIVGGSLNMLDTNIQKMEHPHTSLLSRLLKIEECQLEQIRRRRVGIIGSNILFDDQIANMRRSFTSSRQVMEHIKEESVIGGKAVFIQSNYSMILCVGEASSCPESIRNAAGELQMINRNMVIEQELCKPRRICTVVNFIHEYKDGRRLDRPCITGLEARKYSKSQLSTHYAMIYLTSPNQVNSLKRNTTLDAIVQSNLGKDIISLWTFTKYPMTFKFGALLQLEVLVTSFNPLRLYISPSAVVGPVDALEKPHLFREQMALDELLQYIGEENGLSASSQWWYTLQSLLVKTVVAAEITASKRYPKLECGRCFSAYKAVITCMNIRQCYIIKLTPLLSELINRTTALLPSLLHLLTSERMVSIDVLNPLEEVQRLYGYKICENNIPGQYCLTDLDLLYLLDDRRETMANTNLIKIYPTQSLSMFTPFLNNVRANYSLKEGRSTANFHFILMSLQKHYSVLSKSIPDNIDVSDELDISGTNRKMNYTLQMTNYSGYSHFEECSEDVKAYKEYTLKLEPDVYLQQISENDYQATVDYDVIMIEIFATAKHCSCAISFGDLFKSQRQTSFTLGLGESVLKLVLIDTKYPDPRVLLTIRISINRTMRGRLDEPIEITKLRMCYLKQDCSLPYTPKDECGLYDAHSNWQAFNQLRKPRCKLGDDDGSWVVPCKDCMNINSCFWKHARWEPMQCRYTRYSSKETSNCLKHKKLLFIGDSTNRGILHYILEQINGTLHSMDKTHSIKDYTDLNSGMTNMTFGYYPQFWLPANHRQKFDEIIYQLIKRLLPLENNSNTVIVVGGVHWIVKKHIDIILEVLKRTGLGNITKVVKGLGAGLDTHISGLRFGNKEKQSKLLKREQDVFKYAKKYGFKVIGTFKMTMSRYKDFTYGKCACHFHKISKIAKTNTTETEYKVEGEINAAYSQILLHNICGQT